jgi:uncharacterized protein YecE (DUF72 family)
MDTAGGARGEIRIGTCGWSYPTGRGTWNGVFYPAPRPRGFDELGFYAERFDTVEINSTFYRMPEAAQASRWVARTPADFVFSVKLFQKFTHPDMYLARGGVSDWDPSRVDIDLFRAGIDPLARAQKLGPILMQFPPSFHDAPETRAYLDWLLAAFGDYAVAVELRHKSWSDAHADVSRLLDARRAAWTLIDEPKFAQSIDQRIAPVDTLGAVSLDTPGAGPKERAGATLAYLRLHGRNAAEWWTHRAAEDRYNYLYSDEELQPFADRAVNEAATGRKTYLYLNNHFSAKSVANASVLKRLTAIESQRSDVGSQKESRK